VLLALRGTIDALGGAKVVGSALWPELSVDAGHRRLLDCLNQDRQQRLDPEKLLLLLKLARAKGIHLAMAWILEDVGYAPPQPIEPIDEMAELQKQFIRAAETIEAISKRIDRVRLKGVGERAA
jgi:hypothetical protein